MYTIQEACKFFIDNEHQLTVLTEDERKNFFMSLNKLLLWSYERADKTMDKLLEELK